jgi:cell division protein FtsW
MRVQSYPASRQRRSPVRANSTDTTTGTLRRHRPDYWLLILCVAMLSIGLIIVYAISPALAESSKSSGSYYVVKQLIAIALSLVAFTVTSQLPVSAWRQISKSLLIVAAVATLLAIVMPVNPNYPAHRWVRLGSFSFQSVELLKFALLAWLAGFLADRSREGSIGDMHRTFKPLLIVLGVVGVMVAGIQSDLGSTGVIVAMMGVMAFVAGLPLKRVMMVVGIIAIGTLLAVAVAPYRRERLLAFTHPEADCVDSGYQACQALIAVGSGGMFGLGLGKSVQAYGYLPEAANDSIFAIYAEKFGFVGCLMLLGIMTAFFYRLKTIAMRTPDAYSRLFVVGVLTWLSVQAFINVGAMIGLLPLKGITLPFISYGGTSVVFASAAVGIVFQISRYTNFTSPLDGNQKRRGYDNSRYGRRLGRSHYAGASGR